MARSPINKKTQEKWRKEDLELHKRVITTYLYEKGLKLRSRNKFFILYDREISIDNIYDFLYIPVSVFVTALVLNQLDLIKSYVQSVNPNPIKVVKKSKKRKKR